MKAGGLLMAGPDPTGNGSALAGLADQRNLELLVAGGFSAAEAIRIATLNGAKFLGLEDRVHQDCGHRERANRVKERGRL